MGSVYQQGGRKVWMLKYSRDGRAVYESSRTEEKREAEKLLKLREADVVKGKRVLPKASRYTLAEGLHDVLNDYVINDKRSADAVERRGRLHLLPALGHRRMASITTADVRTYVATR